jgi:RNA polymerase sigma-70 factor, ECF subfamily
MARHLGIHRIVASVFTMGPATTRAPPTLDDVHEQHADFVWRSLQRLGVPSSDLEDSLQEVFIVVHRKLGTFDGSSRLTTWLYGICVRVAAAHRRRAHVRLEVATSELDDTSNGKGEGDPEAALASRQAEERLALALDSLGAEKRAVLIMFEVEGIPATEIAEMIGVPVGTVYSRLSAARAEFARAVARQDRRDAFRGPS